MKHKLIRSRAPLRLGFGGGGTDVSPFVESHGGAVLNMAISKFAHVTIEHRGDGRAAFHSTDIGSFWEGDALTELDPNSAPTLITGVYNRMVKQFNGGKPLSVNVTSYADAPAGSGLGTSSSMVVALTEAFRYWLDAPLGIYELAKLAFDIERRDLSLAGGRQDQYAAAFGGINFMEFRQDDETIINPLRVPDKVVQELESCLVTYFTGVSRESAGIIEEQSKKMRENDKASISALMQLKSDASSMKDALLRGDIAALATILDHSWQEKKRTSPLVSNGKIDKIYNLAMDAGAIGGKVSGAGGGGFMMFLIDPAHRENLLRTLRERGGHASTTTLSPLGACSWRLG